MGRKGVWSWIISSDNLASARIELDKETTFSASDLKSIDLTGAVDLGNVHIAAQSENPRCLLASQCNAAVFPTRSRIDGSTVSIRQEEVILRGPDISPFFSIRMGRQS